MAGRLVGCSLRRVGFSRIGFGTLVGLMLAALLGGLATPSTARAQNWSPPSVVYHPDAGHTLDGWFLNTWRAYPRFLGLPITEELKQKTGLDRDPNAENIVQYYENVALAYLPDLDDGWQVQALQLGKDAARSLDPKFRPNFTAVGTCDELSADECALVPETKHSIRWGFKLYWEEVGLSLLGLPISEEYVQDDGVTVQYFERGALTWKTDVGVAPLPLGKEAADRLKLETKKIEPPADIPVYDEALFIPPVQDVGWGLGYGPGPQVGAYQEIVISIWDQALWAYEGGEVAMSTLVSTGREGFETPYGTFYINEMVESRDMAGVLGGEYYDVPGVPAVMYFTDVGHAIHGTYWHSNFGTPMSHGCINLPMDMAWWLYSWTPIGTPVTII